MNFFTNGFIESLIMILLLNVVLEPDSCSFTYYLVKALFGVCVCLCACACVCEGVCESVTLPDRATSGFSPHPILFLCIQYV